MLWVALAGITALAVLAALWPLLRAAPATADAAGAADAAFYRAQLDEIARDVERGQLPEAEAAAARAEAARRLIAASAAAAAPPPAAPQGRLAAAALIVVALPALAFPLYAYIGQPGMPDLPLAARSANKAHPGGVEAAVAGVEARLLANPDDGKGWALLAPVYIRLGRYDDAARAYSEALRLLGEDGARRAAYGEALVAAAGGIVTAKAREAFDKALADEPGQPQARFYLALGLEQEGKSAEAIAAYESLLKVSPANAPWTAPVKTRLAALKGEPPLTAAAPSAEPPGGAQAEGGGEGQDAMIRGMVARLATRLSSSGGDLSEWSRLIRAYSVLHEPDKARTALADARRALGPDAGAPLDALARDLAIGD